jgi:hypothetical protein
LVGGFSESPYMYDTIKKFAKDLRLQAFRPASAYVNTPRLPINPLIYDRWSAVVRGAATAGLEGGDNLVKYRKCRRSYGTDSGHHFRAGKHHEYESYVSDFTGEKLALGQMDWIVKKGEDLATRKDAHAKLEHTLDFWPKSRRTTSVGLYASEEDNPPQRKTDWVSRSLV